MNNDYINFLKSSVYCAQFWQLGNNWSTTQCCEVLHSTYKAYNTIKQQLMDEILYNGEDAEEFKFEGEPEILSTLINTVLYPFQARWHHIFFKNVEFGGYNTTTKPRKWVSKKQRGMFREEHAQLRESVQEYFTTVTNYRNMLSEPEADIEPPEQTEEVEVSPFEELSAGTHSIAEQALRGAEKHQSMDHTIADIPREFRNKIAVINGRIADVDTLKEMFSGVYEYSDEMWASIIEIFNFMADGKAAAKVRDNAENN